MTKYKILKVGEQQKVCGFALEQKVTIIAELDSFNTKTDESERMVNIIREKKMTTVMEVILLQNMTMKNI